MQLKFYSVKQMQSMQLFIFNVPHANWIIYAFIIAAWFYVKDLAAAFILLLLWIKTSDLSTNMCQRVKNGSSISASLTKVKKV